MGEGGAGCVEGSVGAAWRAGRGHWGGRRRGGRWDGCAPGSDGVCGAGSTTACQHWRVGGGGSAGHGREVISVDRQADLACHCLYVYEGGAGRAMKGLALRRRTQRRLSVPRGGIVRLALGLNVLPVCQDGFRCGVGVARGRRAAVCATARRTRYAACAARGSSARRGLQRGRAEP